MTTLSELIGMYNAPLLPQLEALQTHLKCEDMEDLSDRVRAFHLDEYAHTPHGACVTLVAALLLRADAQALAGICEVSIETAGAVMSALALDVIHDPAGLLGPPCSQQVEQAGGYPDCM